MNTINKQQSNFLKLVGIITMAIDHAGAILMPEFLFLRVIGRIAFPIFAYQIVVGYIHTHDFKKYFWRLLGLGILFQVPYTIATGSYTLNIFFTLAIGLVCLWLIDNRKSIAVIGILLVTAFFDNFQIIISYLNINSGWLFQIQNYVQSFDYGLYGLLTIILMFVLLENNKYLVMAFICLNLVFISFYGISELQIFAPLAMIFIARPLSLKLKISSWFFYLFYPAHIVILYLIKIIWFA